MQQSLSAQILVINLKHSTDRWLNVSKQLDQLGMPYTRIDAVWGKELTQEQLSAVVDTSRSQREFHYQLTAGEIACYLSHLKAWQYIVDHQLDYAVVLEDDVCFSSDFKDIHEAIAAVSEPWHVLKLAAPFKQQPAITTRAIKQFDLVRYRKPPIGACAQVVSLAGAKRLLAQRPPLFRPIDVDMQWQHELGLQVYGLLPYTVDNTHTHGSDIKSVADRRQVKRHPWRRLKHQLLLYLDGRKATAEFEHTN